MKKVFAAVPLIFLILLLLPLEVAQANPLGPPNVRSIVIASDGSVDPSDAPISRIGSNEYHLTSNLSAETYSLFNTTVYNIVVQRANIILDGENHSIKGAGSQGIRLDFVNGITVKNFVLSGFDSAIEVYSSSNINLLNNSVTTYAFGFEISHSTNVLVEGNNLEDMFDQAAIFLISTNSSIIYNNNLFCSSLKASAFRIEDSYNNFIEANRIANFGSGINFITSSNNSFYQNSLIGNAIQAQDLFSHYQNLNEINQQINQRIHKAIMPIYYPSVNTWKNNYWSDYNGTDNNIDGIGDTPYKIDANNTDYYPLIKLSNVIPSNTINSITITPKAVEDNPILTILAVIVIAFVIVLVVLVLFYRRRKRQG